MSDFEDIKSIATRFLALLAEDEQGVAMWHVAVCNLGRQLHEATAAFMPIVPPRSDFEIIEKYMPPHPQKDTQPTCVIRYIPTGSFLRHSKGPRQGHSLDMYGDDYQTIALAEEAIAMVQQRGPSVPGGLLYQK